MPDGKTLATAALQRAVDQAHAAGGGVVVVPPGVYRTGTLRLRSRVTLELLPGSTLIGSENLSDYPEMPWPRLGDRHRHHLIVADDAESITIRGGGTIDGNVPAFWEPFTLPRAWIRARSPRVSPMIELRKCRDVRICDVTITNSPGWTVHGNQCDRLWIRGIKLVNPMLGPNTDGLDISGCRDVLVSDSVIECGDDAIVLKTGQDGRPLERVTVTNCVIKTYCVALKLGAMESYHDMRQVTFANCVVHNSNRAVGLYSLRGAVQEDIAVSNIVCDTDSGFLFNRPIHIDARAVDGGKPGHIRNVQISNFVCRTDGRILMTAADGAQVRDVLLRDVQLAYPIIDDPEPLGRTAGGSQFSNHSPDARAARAAIVADGLERLVIDGLRIRWPEPGSAAGWSGPKQEDGSPRPYPGRKDDQDPPFHAIWGRKLKGGLVRAPLVESNRAGVDRCCWIECAGVKELS